ncbi:hypothetical protein ACSBR2_023186 [Camellia fascicularis]
MISIYTGIPCKYTSHFQGLEKFVSKVCYKPGCNDVACSNNNQLKATTEVAAAVDVVIVVLGLSQSFEADMVDRLNLTLPGYQELLVIEVAKVAKWPFVLVCMSGGHVDLSFSNNTMVKRILWVGYPGQAGGDAITQFIITLTHAVSYIYIYIYHNPIVTLCLYCQDFGHGLSYSVFSKFIMSTPSTVHVRHRDNTNVIISFNYIDISALECHNLYLDVVIGLRNDGPNDGTYVVLVFWDPTNAQGMLIGTPKKQLVAFERIQVNIKETEKMTVKLDICKQLNIADCIGLG